MKKIIEENATIDDIYNIPFIKMLTRVSSEILFARKNDFDTITDEEKSVLDLNQLVRNIMYCLDSIRMAIVFSKRYDKQYLSKNEVNEEQCMTYHYDVIVHKLATIKELEFKIVYQLYNLPKEDGKYSWNTINSHKNIINNEQLFEYFNNESHYNFISYFVNRRNKSTHEGKLSIPFFREVTDLLWIRGISNNPRYKDIPGSDYANSHYVSLLVNKSRKETLSYMEQIYQSSINLRCMFFNSLCEDLNNIFTIDAKEEQ